MPRTRFEKKKEGASESEVDLEPASQLSCDERGYAEVVEADLVEFINGYANDEDEGTFESPPSKKGRGGISRAEKGGGFNEVLKTN